MSDWISVEDKLPCYPSTVLVAYQSDSDGEPCLDVGEAILQKDGKWYGLGVFYRPRKSDDIQFRADLCEKLVTHWKPMPEPPK